MRAGGVLMHITSLSSPYGIGTIGKAAYEFVDFLKEAGQSYWQILPLCPTGYGDSPYQSFSTFAGNPYLIDLEDLLKEKYLTKKELQAVDWESGPLAVNFDAMYRKRFGILKKAVSRFLKEPSKEYTAFLKDENSFWLEDYALFMALKDAHGGAPWQEWEEDLKCRKPSALKAAGKKYAAEIEFWKVLQFFFREQWDGLRKYAGDNGIELIGDLPIYVACDSADVWSNTALFQLDEKLEPTDVAGCLPDGFSATGQLWGNPLFDWGKMAEDGYGWWLRRIRHCFGLVDVLRIDHFRAFSGYYAIPAGDPDARNGQWKPGPGIQFFKEIEKQLGKKRIIAEDLGFLTPDVRKLLKKTGFPGMKVLEFAFDSRDGNGNDYRPYLYPEKCVAYVGTHDNDTAAGWMKTAPASDRKVAREYLNLNRTEGYHWGMMRGIWASPAELAIVQAQDILGLGSEARMNTPSTLGNNWTWRAPEGAFDQNLAKKCREKMELYGRLPKGLK